MIFFSIIVILSLLIFVTVNFLFIQIINTQTQSNNLSKVKNIKISIIIAAKNEADKIERLLISLSQLDYPAANFEVIIVDDKSIDKTNSIVKKFISNLPNFKLVSSDGKTYPAKKGALSIGINEAKYEYIATTDADCVIQKDWLKISAFQFAEGNDIIFGLTPYFQNKNLVNRISSFERFRGQLLTFLFAKLNLPYSAGGGNFGFKKSSFLKIKGYENTLQTLSGDDDLLINEAAKNKLIISPILHSHHLVKTDSPESWRMYFRQRARHTSTSLYYRKEVQTILALWHLSNIILLFSPILIIYNWIFVIPFILKLLFDIFIVKSKSKLFDYHFTPLSVIVSQIVYELLLMIHFINSFGKKRSW